ncbi:hypothetical protein JMJ56_25390 [Belnapia sp. T18]|uniref:Uncharacterized protein n=1 Tax=Belnapia arida TaxID=2804533 RepID=A0ABS1U9G6_9PROT|nr:hypothetical protein [Belnapia arida]MBL6081334.1 hypothetical protein [Belnapia arida]
MDNTNLPHDFLAIANQYFGEDQAEVVEGQLDSLIVLLTGYFVGLKRTGRGSERQARINLILKHLKGLRLAFNQLDVETLAGALDPATSGKIMALERELAELPDQTLAKLRRALLLPDGLPPLHTEVGEPGRLYWLGTLKALRETLGVLETGLTAIEAATERQPANRPKRSDVLSLGLEELERIWRRHRPDPPNQSTNANGFGGLAQTLFAAPPFAFTTRSVGHAVAARLPKRANQ